MNSLTVLSLLSCHSGWGSCKRWVWKHGSDPHANDPLDILPGPGSNHGFGKKPLLNRSYIYVVGNLIHQNNTVASHTFNCFGFPMGYNTSNIV